MCARDPLTIRPPASRTRRCCCCRSTALASCKLQTSVCAALDPSACAAASDSCEAEIWQNMFESFGSQLFFMNPYNLKAPCESSADCYNTIDTRLTAYINARKAKLGAPANVSFAACADAPYTALSTDMVRSYDTLVAGLLDNGECGWSLGRGGEGVGVQGALEN